MFKAARANRLWWDSENTDPVQQEGIHVDLKLAGNQLSNFSAFLDAEWRRNDWLWGRLDAVPTLVELLVTPELLAGVPDGEADRELWLEDLFLGPAEPGSPMRAFLAQEVLNAAGRAQVLEELGSGGQPRELRRALVAVRQWEILAEELCGDQPAADPAALAEQLLAAVARHDFGAEGIRSQRVRNDVRTRLSKIGDVASQVALYSAQLEPEGGFLGSPGAPSLYGRSLRRLVQFGGRRAAKRVTRP